MKAVAKGKDEALLAAIVSEKKRVIESAQRNEAGTK